MIKYKFTTQRLVLLALLIAMQIILSRFLAIELDFIRISFVFLPLILIGAYYPPLIAGFACALADTVGVLLYSKGVPFFPGYTLTTFLTGFVYSIFLYNKPKVLWRIIVSHAVVFFLLNSVLNTYWLSIILDKAALALFPIRLLKNAIVFVIYIFISYFFFQSQIIPSLLTFLSTPHTKK